MFRVPVLAPEASVEFEFIDRGERDAGWASGPRLDLGGIPVVEVDIGGQTAIFIVDTGAERNLVRPEALRRLGLPEAPGPLQHFRGINGPVSGHRLALRQLGFGGRTFRDQPFVAVDLVDFFEAVGGEIAGLLGRPFFGDEVLLFETDVLHLGEPEETLALERLPARDGVIVEVVLDGVTLEGWIDTGAARSSLSWTAARKVGVEDLRPGGAQVGAEGLVHPVAEATFDDLVLGPTRFMTPLLQVGHADERVELRVGMDLLERLDGFGVDFGEQEVLVGHLRQLQ
jgi:predicted aspartyl protease